MVFINLYWKDGHSGKTDEHKSSSLHNQAIGIVCQEAAAMMPDVGTYYLASKKASNRKCLLKVAQTTVQCLAS